MSTLCHGSFRSCGRQALLLGLYPDERQQIAELRGQVRPHNGLRIQIDVHRSEQRLRQRPLLGTRGRGPEHPHILQVAGRLFQAQAPLLDRADHRESLQLVPDAPHVGVKLRLVAGPDLEGVLAALQLGQQSRPPGLDPGLLALGIHLPEEGQCLFPVGGGQADGADEPGDLPLQHFLVDRALPGTALQPTRARRADEADLGALAGRLHPERLATGPAEQAPVEQVHAPTRHARRWAPAAVGACLGGDLRDHGLGGHRRMLPGDPLPFVLDQAAVERALEHVRHGVCRPEAVRIAPRPALFARPAVAHAAAGGVESVRHLLEAGRLALRRARPRRGAVPVPRLDVPGDLLLDEHRRGLVVLPGVTFGRIGIAIGQRPIVVALARPLPLALARVLAQLLAEVFGEHGQYLQVHAPVGVAVVEVALGDAAVGDAALVHLCQRGEGHDQVAGIAVEGMGHNDVGPHAALPKVCQHLLEPRPFVQVAALGAVPLVRVERDQPPASLLAVPLDFLALSR